MALNRGITVGINTHGINTHGGNVYANANVGRIEIVKIALHGNPKNSAKNPTKIPKQVVPQIPRIVHDAAIVGTCYGNVAAPKQIKSGYPKLTKSETVATLAEKMKELVGSHVGASKQCIEFVKAVNGIGATGSWIRGARVKGNKSIKPGTPIATFGLFGKYMNRTYGSSHAAVFVKFVTGGIQVWHKYAKKRVHLATIKYKNGQGTANNDGDRYYIINIVKPK